jgi:flavin-dependent dehydrogenase
MLLARRGLRVLAIDRAAYRSDTLSTHALMRGGVLQLERWGLLEQLRQAGTPAVRSTAFHYGDEVIDVAIKPRDGIDALYAPRRTVLDALLVDAARRAGAEIRHETRLVDLVRRPDGTVGGIVLRDPRGRTESIGAGIVIGADGRRSSVARRVGARAYRTGRHATGVVYGYWQGLEPDGYHWYYRTGVSAGRIATNDAVCVFASVPGPRFAEVFGSDLAAGYMRTIEACDGELAESLRGAQQLGKLYPFAGAPGFMRQSYGPGWALVGDAGYFKDPLTAHGITDALRDAELLAHAVAAGSSAALAGYQILRDRMSGDLFDVTDRIASFDWDLDRVKQLHLTLSKQMNREVEQMTRFDAQLPLSA